MVLQPITKPFGFVFCRKNLRVPHTRRWIVKFHLPHDSDWIRPMNVPPKGLCHIHRVYTTQYTTKTTSDHSLIYKKMRREFSSHTYHAWGCPGSADIKSLALAWIPLNRFMPIGDERATSFPIRNRQIEDGPRNRLGHHADTRRGTVRHQKTHVGNQKALNRDPTRRLRLKRLRTVVWSSTPLT